MQLNTLIQVVAVFIVLMLIGFFCSRKGIFTP